MELLVSERFRVLRELGVGGMGVVYEAVDEETGAVVALKTLKALEPAAIHRFKKEFRALADLQHPNLLRLGELHCEADRWFFTMEVVHGQSFDAWVRRSDHSPADEDSLGAPASTMPTQPSDRPGRELRAISPVADSERRFDEARLRDAAGQLAEGLAALHRGGHVHRDVKPSNVLVRSDGRVVLLDFGLVEEMYGERPFDDDPLRNVVGTPAFMAPEQVRGERLGSAADWYAFGVVLYLALTGRVPFVGTAQQILARKLVLDAPRPSELQPDVPRDLEQLVFELVARDPLDRPDAREIVARLHHRSGKEDTPIPTLVRQLVTPFVGREAEVTTLAHAFGRVYSGGTEIVLVQGEAGVGKTALVQRFVDTHASDRRTVVLSGRCYEQESVPFKGFDALLDRLSLHLGHLPEAEVRALCGEGVAFLGSLFPVLRRVQAIADLTPVDTIGAKARRAEAFRELRGLFAAMGARAPLVLWLEDLQWADKDSLALLEALLGGDEPPRLLFMATMRPGPVPDELRAGRARLRTIALGGLSPDESRTLWQVLWKSPGVTALTAPPPNDGALLAEAAGHPLFLAELVRYACVMPEQAAAGMHLAEVLWRRVQALDPPSRRFLETVALAGAPVRYPVIAAAAGLDASDTLPMLGVLRSAQLVRIDRRGHDRLVEPYHDRVREAILAHAGGAAEMGERRLRLGRALLDHTSASELPTAVFGIVQHLNQVVGLLEPAERRRLAELNLLAGRQAKLATAYDAASGHLERGLLQLEGDPWQDAHELCLQLSAELIEADHLGGRREAARRRWQDALARVGSERERANLYASWIELETGAGEFVGAVEAARAGLAHFGEPLPGRAGAMALLGGIAQVRWRQGRRDVASLAQLGELEDERLAAVIQLLMAVAPAVFFGDAALLPVVVLTIARISLAHGVSEASAYGFTGYGIVLSGAFSRHASAHAFGELALALNQRFHNRALEPKLLMMSGNYLTPWVRPWAEAQMQLRRAAESARRTGDPQYEAYAVTSLAMINHCAEEELGRYHSWAESAHVITTRRRSEDMSANLVVSMRYADALRGHADRLDSLCVDEADAAELDRQLADEVRLPSASAMRWLYETELAYLGGNFERAEAALAQARQRARIDFSVPTAAELCFWGVMVECALYRRSSFLARRPLSWRIARGIRRLSRWARSCPANFEACWRLALAEQLACRDDSSAAGAFETAIATARQHGRLKGEALALELAARCFGDESLRKEAVLAWRRFGAEAKAREVEAAELSPRTSRRSDPAR